MGRIHVEMGCRIANGGGISGEWGVYTREKGEKFKRVNHNNKKLFSKYKRNIRKFILI